MNSTRKGSRWARVVWYLLQRAARWLAPVIALRLTLWIVIGAVSISGVMLADIGRLLTDIESDGQRAFGPAVFTGFKLVFWNTADLADAITLWRASEAASAESLGVLHLLKWHLLIDALVFAPAYCLLILYGLKRLGATYTTAATIALSLLVLDEVETWATFVVLVGGALADVATWLLVLLQWFSFLKWGALAGAGVIAFVLWKTPGGVSFESLMQVVGTARTGRAQHPVEALAGIIVVTLLFIALVALPAGGPLNQIPDVLRGQLADDGLGWVSLLTSVATALLATCAVIAGWTVTDPSHAYPKLPTTSSGKVLRWTLLLSAILTAIAWIVDGTFRVVPLAPLLVALSVWGSATLARRAGVTASKPTSAAPETAPVPDDGEVPTTRANWVGGIGGAIIVATGLGLVRASYPPFLLDVPDGRVDWRLALGGGILVSLLGGFLVQSLVAWAEPRVVAASGTNPTWRQRFSLTAAFVGVATVAVASYLVVNPEDAWRWGTTGVVAIGYAVTILAIGGLTWMSRALPGWTDTYCLGLGYRTPWLTLVLVTWGVASVLNTAGVYHDARVDADLGPMVARYASPRAAFESWRAAQVPACGTGRRNEIPMVLVAAPGGGIRAAYWTAAVLDSLFGDQRDGCTTRRLFAVSGVSGGSVGATTWLIARSAGRRGRDAAASISGDRALASATAGLLLRDVYQPFTGISTAWRDRAALLEDGWIKASKNTFAPNDTLGLGRRWSEIGEGLPWVPMLMLNASSVNDGCRLLITSVGELPTTDGGMCASDAVGRRGSVTSAIDPLRALRGRSDLDPDGCKGGNAGLRAATAALLSARFPVVSPSGALVHCTIGQRLPGDSAPSPLTTHTTYAVDGGYYENSGLLSLLQLWAEVEPLVRQHNDASAAGQPRIVPWIVVVDNHYRSAARVAPHGRPYELLAPVRSLSNKRLVSQTALEEMARVAMRPAAERCAGERFPADSAHIASGQPFDTTSVAEDITRGCVAVIAPARRPSVGAPLGWVLSTTSQEDLDVQLVARLRQGRSEGERGFGRLLAMLVGGAEVLSRPQP